MNTTAAAPEMQATEWKTEEWGMGTPIVAHLRSHENQWPPSWEDLLNRRGRSSTPLAVSPTDPLVAIVEFEGRGPWALIPPTPTR